jgi:hypothetical protein
MCATQLMRLVRVEGCVNSPEHHVGAASARYLPNLVTAESICRVDADADDIAGLNLNRVQSLQRLIDEARIAKGRGCRGRKDI